MNKLSLSEEVIERARAVKLLVMDCDGVLTDGKLYFSENGEELKAFHVHDGQGIVNWHNAGFHSGIITGRESKILKQRVDELGIHFLVQNSKNKVKDFEKILHEYEVKFEEVAYVGDDLGDIDLLKLVGFPVAVANSHASLAEVAFFLTSKKAGSGAIREVCDTILLAKESC